MLKKIILLSLIVMAMPAIALAAGSYVYDFTILSDKGEAVVEVINLVLAVLTAAFAIKLAALSQGGDLEKTWNWLAIAASAFALLEIYGALNGLKLVHVAGLGDIIELVMVAVLFIVFYRTRKTLLKRSLGGK